MRVRGGAEFVERGVGGIDHFGGEDGAVDFDVSISEFVILDGLPVDVFEASGRIQLVEAVVGEEGHTPCYPGSHLHFRGFDGCCWVVGTCWDGWMGEWLDEIVSVVGSLWISPASNDDS